MLALLLLLGAWLAGPAKLALRVRTFLRPALTARPEIVHGVVLAVLLALLAIGIVPGHPHRDRRGAAHRHRGGRRRDGAPAGAAQDPAARPAGAEPEPAPAP